ncbi:hypothetical protein R3P38DRAFT_196012 [Favolaschia claudopus]|uniref:Uncharacterized protein n=1 Tax=Favolaschia claudopus TaxID=2862362 RepID=A0AAV9ZU48_9AGAR
MAGSKRPPLFLSINTLALALSHYSQHLFPNLLAGQVLSQLPLSFRTLPISPSLTMSSTIFESELSLYATDMDPCAKIDRAVDRSSVFRQPSPDCFGTLSSFGDLNAPMDFNFSWGQDLAIEAAPPLDSSQKTTQEERLPLPRLQRSDSISSSFSMMSEDDELNDEVDPWTTTRSNTFDFGFSGALRHACSYQVPNQYLPSDAESDVAEDDTDTLDSESEEDDVGDESDTIIDSAEELEDDGEQDDDAASDAATVCGEEPEAAVDDFFMDIDYSYASEPIDVPDNASPSVRRSTRISQASYRAKNVDKESSSVSAPAKRKRAVAPAKSRKEPPAKKMAFVGKADKPTPRKPASKPSSRSSSRKKKCDVAKKRRVILLF